MVCGAEPNTPESPGSPNPSGTASPSESAADHGSVQGSFLSEPDGWTIPAVCKRNQILSEGGMGQLEDPTPGSHSGGEGGPAAAGGTWLPSLPTYAADGTRLPANATRRPVRRVLRSEDSCLNYTTSTATPASGSPATVSSVLGDPAMAFSPGNSRGGVSPVHTAAKEPPTLANTTLLPPSAGSGDGPSRPQLPPPLPPPDKRANSSYQIDEAVAYPSQRSESLDILNVCAQPAAKYPTPSYGRSDTTDSQDSSFAWWANVGSQERDLAAGLQGTHLDPQENQAGGLLLRRVPAMVRAGESRDVSAGFRQSSTTSGPLERDTLLASMMSSAAPSFPRGPGLERLITMGPPRYRQATDDSDQVAGPPRRADTGDMDEDPLAGILPASAASARSAAAGVPSRMALGLPPNRTRAPPELNMPFPLVMEAPEEGQDALALPPGAFHTPSNEPFAVSGAAARVRTFSDRNISIISEEGPEALMLTPILSRAASPILSSGAAPSGHMGAPTLAQTRFSLAQTDRTVMALQEERVAAVSALLSYCPQKASNRLSSSESTASAPMPQAVDEEECEGGQPEEGRPEAMALPAPRLATGGDDDELLESAGLSSDEEPPKAGSSRGSVSSPALGDLSRPPRLNLGSWSYAEKFKVVQFSSPRGSGTSASAIRNVTESPPALCLDSSVVPSKCPRSVSTCNPVHPSDRLLAAPAPSRRRNLSEYNAPYTTLKIQDPGYFRSSPGGASSSGGNSGPDRDCQDLSSLVAPTSSRRTSTLFSEYSVATTNASRTVTEESFVADVYNTSGPWRSKREEKISTGRP